MCSSDLSDWIPSGHSIWQYKSGRGLNLRVLRKELKKIGVSRAVGSGDSYCLMSCDSIGDKRRQNFEECIEKAYGYAGQSPRYCIYPIDQIAEWLSEYPALSAQYADLRLRGWYTFDLWIQMQRLQNPFVYEQPRNDLIQAIRTRIEACEKTIRVGGGAGVGKTRTVLEALNTEDIRNLVLYHPDAESGARDLLWDLQAHGRGSGILVIDECTPSILTSLRDAAQLLPVGFTIVFVGPTDTGRKGNYIELAPMKQESIEKILEDFIPGSLHPLRSQIAMRCSGYPKLAVLVGEAYSLAIAAGNTAESLEEIEEQETVVEYLVQRWIRTGSEKAVRLLKGFSLLTRVGWYGDVAHEGQAVCRLMCVDFAVAQDHVGTLLKSGALSQRGRFLYVTPDLLATHLTREVLKRTGSDRIKDFLKELAEEGRVHFVERLRQVGDNSEGRALLQSLLSEEFFFETLDDLKNPGVSHIVRLLVTVFPSLLFSRLQLLIESATVDELRAATAARRDLVWALGEIAWFPQHFATSAQLLLRLAIAENEEYGNNATGVWRSLFQIVLAATATPFPERRPILEDAIRSPDPQARLLGLGALQAALQTGTITGSVGPSADVGAPAPPHWEPRTYGEWRSIIDALVPLLAERLGDSNEEVREYALEVFNERLNDLVNTGLLERVQELTTLVTEEPMDKRQPILETLDWRLKRSDDLTKEQQQTLGAIRNMIAGHDLQERIKEYAGPWHYGTSSEPDTQLQDDLRSIARLLVENPEEFDMSLPWLASGEANSGYLLGRDLGQVDTNDSLLTLITAFWEPDIQDHRFFVGYLQGLADRHGHEWIEDLLDQLADYDRTTTLSAYGTWQCASTDRGARRLTTLIKNRRIPSHFIRHLPTGFWAKKVSPAAISELVEACLGTSDPPAILGALDVLSQYFKLLGRNFEPLEDVTRRVLNESASITDHTRNSYAWSILAKLLAPRESINIARLCVIIAKSAERIPHRKDIREVLGLCIRQTPEKILTEVFGPEIEVDISFLRHFDDRLEGDRVIEKFDPSLITAWVEQDVERRLSPVAHATSVHSNPAGSLARALLVKWSDRREVQGALSATFHSGGWWGPQSVWIQTKIDTLKNWKSDSDPNVRRWAVLQESYFQEELPRAKQRDQELGLL